MSRSTLALGTAAALLLLAPIAAGAPKKVHPNEVRSESSWARDAADESQAKPGGSVVLLLLGEPDALNPYLSTSADVDDILRLVYPTLMREDVDYAKGPPRFDPYLAESWEFSADRRTLTFHLRKDMTWSDGVPVTAEDVRFSWRTAKDKDVAWVNNSIKDFIDDVKVVDPKTVALHYTETYPYQVMDANDGYIVPEHVFSKIPYADWKNHASWTAEAGVAGGPYRVAGYVPQETVTLEANPKYYRAGYPRIPKVTFRIIKNQQAQLDALLSGGVDALQSIRPGDAKRILDDGRFRLFNFMSRNYSYIGWNCARPPFDDAEVRRAMTLAIDREDLVESLYLGYAEVSSSSIISSMWAHDETLNPWPCDPDEAQKVLVARGWRKAGDGVFAKDGRRLSFTMKTNAENQLRVRAATRVQANLKEAGVEAKIEQVEFNLLAEQLRKHDFDAYAGAWSVATKVDEKPTFHSASRGYDGFNWVNYANPRVDEIIDKARVMSDFAAAKPLWVEFQRILHQDQPYTFVSEPRNLNAYVKGLRNVLSAATGAYFNLEEWWWEGTGR